MAVYLLITPVAGGSIGATFPLLLTDLGLLALGLAVYGAVFAFIGALRAQAARCRANSGVRMGAGGAVRARLSASFHGGPLPPVARPALRCRRTTPSRPFSRCFRSRRRRVEPDVAGGHLVAALWLAARTCAGNMSWTVGYVLGSVGRRELGRRRVRLLQVIKPYKHHDQQKPLFPVRCRRRCSSSALGAGLIAYSPITARRRAGRAAAGNAIRAGQRRAGGVRRRQGRHELGAATGAHAESIAGSRKGRQMMNDFAGVDLEKQVDHVVAYVEPVRPPVSRNAARKFPGCWCWSGYRSISARSSVHPRARRHHGGLQRARRCSCTLRRPKNGRRASSDPDLIAIGQADLVRRAIDSVRDGGRGAREHHRQCRDDESHSRQRRQHGMGGRPFDAISRRMRLPSDVTGQVPPVRLVSVKADINGGMKATIRAETGDQAAADQLRDVVRGLRLACRLQAERSRSFENALKSIELSGTTTPCRCLSPWRPKPSARSPPRGGRGGRGAPRAASADLQALPAIAVRISEVISNRDR